MMGDDISITVPGVNGNRVRRAIGAAGSLAMHRQQPWRRIEHERSGTCTSSCRSPADEVPGAAANATSAAQRQEQNLGPDRLRR
jgi:sRNA-binding carbon storage regulator CsrA